MDISNILMMINVSLNYWQKITNKIQCNIGYNDKYIKRRWKFAITK